MYVRGNFRYITIRIFLNWVMEIIPGVYTNFWTFGRAGYSKGGSLGNTNILKVGFLAEKTCVLNYRENPPKPGHATWGGGGGGGIHFLSICHKSQFYCCTDLHKMFFNASWHSLAVFYDEIAFCTTYFA